MIQYRLQSDTNELTLQRLQYLMDSIPWLKHFTYELSLSTGISINHIEGWVSTDRDLSLAMPMELFFKEVLEKKN